MINIHGYKSKESFGNIEKKERFQCSLCSSTFKYKKGLNEHIKLVHERRRNGPSSSKTFKCDECDSAFTMDKNLQAHKKVQHSTSPKEFKCTNCGRVFNKKSNLTRHEIIHKKSE